MYSIEIEQVKLREQMTQNTTLLIELKGSVGTLVAENAKFRGIITALSICFMVVSGIISWFVQDKIAGYESWNRQQDVVVQDVRNQQGQLSDRVTKLEMIVGSLKK